MSLHIYLDYNASTPIAPEVRAVMLPLLESAYGNPSSPHWAGAPAKRVVEEARAQVAELIGAHPDEVVFTSGGSESTNAAIKGAAFAVGVTNTHLITTAVEHPATMVCCRFLERLGARLDVLPVDATGRIDPERLPVVDRTTLISAMHANNETGTLQPIAELGARKGPALLHCDAAQSAGKVAIDVDQLGVDLVTLAGHKLYAPKGIGALYVRRGTRLEPLIHGGGHESGRRAGTESAILAAALGAACVVARAQLERADEVRRLRDRLHEGLVARLGDRITLFGHPEARLPNTLNVGFAAQNGAEVLSRLDGVAASTGSACHEGSVTLSPVLEAMGVDPDVGRGAVRFSLGRGTTEAEIDAVLAQIPQRDP